MKFLLIPVKDLEHANKRLASVMTQKERTSLAYSMLFDVFDAASKSALSDRVVVVTMDKKAISMAENYGFRVIEENSQESESSSVDFALKICKDEGANSVLVIPGDAPLITADDIDFLFKKSRRHSHLILVPASDKMGTNAILRNPPDIITSMFGHDSFKKHIRQAEEKNIPYEIFEIDNIALDIDEPSDIENLIVMGQHTNTYRELLRLGYQEDIEKTGHLIHLFSYV